MYIKCNKGKLLEEMNYDMWKLIYQQASLIKHEATVHGDKTFICKAFETLFGQKIHLRRHKVIYLQGLWKLTFGRKLHLRNHEETVHEGKSLQGDIYYEACDNQFGRKHI